MLLEVLVDLLQSSLAGPNVPGGPLYLLAGSQFEGELEKTEKYVKTEYHNMQDFLAHSIISKTLRVQKQHFICILYLF